MLTHSAQAPWELSSAVRSRSAARRPLRRGLAAVLLAAGAVLATAALGCGGGGGGGGGGDAAATPTFSPAAGTYAQAQQVSLASATAGAVIHYTTDGSTPTAASTTYASPIAVSATTTIKAIAVAAGHQTSAVATALYTIQVTTTPQAVAPTFSPGGGTYAKAQAVTIASSTAGAAIYYTTDGTTPTAASARYTAAVTVSASQTLQAIAIATGYQDSAVARADYLIQGAQYALPADRVTSWQPGVTYAVATGPNAPAPGSAPSGWTGGIPVRTQVCATVNPSNDATGATDHAAIQAAIDKCPASQVVKLGPGTFTVPTDRPIHLKSYVTVRGSGAAQVGTSGATFVRSITPGASVLFAFGNWSNNDKERWWQPVALAADAAKGSYSVQLAAATAATVGEIVSVDEQYDPTLTYWDATQIDDLLGWGEWRKPELGSVEADRAASRPIGQAMEIASINTASPYSAASPLVTFTAPFHRTYRTARAAHVARLTTDGGSAPVVQWAGLEDLTLLNGMAGDGHGNVAMYGAKYSWVKHVESHGAQILLLHAYRCEVRDSFIHTGQATSPGGGGYGLEIEAYAADNLVENNIVWSFNKVMVMRSSGGGNVIGYNYMEDGYGARYGNCHPNWNDYSCSGAPENGLNATHMATPHEELFEGNQSFNGSADSRWGNSIDITYFRNHLTATRRNVGNGSGTESTDGEPDTWCDGSWACAGPVVRLQDDDNRRAAGASRDHYNYSFVGNVLGYPDGYLQTVAAWPGSPYPATFHHGETGFEAPFLYEGVEGAFQDYAAYIWKFEEHTLQVGPGTTPGLLRDGNYDYVTRAVHWHGIGGSGEKNGLTAPGVAALPNSLYIPAAMQPPPFFAGETWPWIDGSNAANPIPGRLPARTRFDLGTPDTVR